MSYAGIDYGLGSSNIDATTGIRYGVISQHSVMPEAMEYVEMDYGTPHCPECGNDAVKYEDEKHGEYEERQHICADYACESCETYLDSSEVFSDEAIGWSYDGEGYRLQDCLDSDIFILASPFYTFAQFCSPCVPGAGNLDNAMEDGVKTFALGHNWFEDEQAPYPVYRVSDGSLVTA